VATFETYLSYLYLPLFKVHVTKSLKLKNSSFIMFAVDPPESTYTENRDEWYSIIKKMFFEILFSAEKLMDVSSISIPIMDLSLIIFIFIIIPI
jgi:hypothetical protein